MRTFRVIWRALALITMTLAICLPWLLGKLMLALFRQPELRWRKLILCSWAKFAAKIIGIRMEVRGDPPQSPFFLVSNHLSYVDIVVLAAQLNCVFVAKSEIQKWPGFGLLGRSVNTIYIDRGNIQDIPRVIGLINKTLDKGLGVVLFAEGTSSKGEKVLPFTPTLLEPAARGNYPVSYASISYRTPPDEVPAHLSVCWWGDMTLIPHLIRMLRLPGFDAYLTFGSHAILSDDRKTLAKALWSAVNDQFIPVIESSSLNHEKEA